MTLLGKRSPTTRINGPVVLINNGFNTDTSAKFARSPIASAAISLTVTEPFIKPCSKMVYKGSRDLGRVNKGRMSSPLVRSSWWGPTRWRAALAVDEMQERMNSM